MSNIIKNGGGSRSIGSQVGIQSHLTNECLPSRSLLVSPVTGKKMKWRPTKINLAKLDQSVRDYCESLRGVDPILLETRDANYAEKFADQKRRACPARRKQYNAQEEGNSLVVAQPYMEKKYERKDEHPPEEPEEFANSNLIDPQPETAPSEEKKYQEFVKLMTRQIRVKGSWFEGDFALVHADESFVGYIRRDVEIKFPDDRQIYRVYEINSLLPYSFSMMMPNF